MKNVRRVETGDNSFDILVDGERKWRCEREHLSNGRRGAWNLFVITEHGEGFIERNQYSNDIMESVQIYEDRDERPNASPFMTRFFETVEDAKATLPFEV